MEVKFVGEKLKTVQNLFVSKKLYVHSLDKQLLFNYWNKYLTFLTY
jgi:hypothetical protein